MNKKIVLLRLILVNFCFASAGSAYAVSLSEAQAVEKMADIFATANDFKTSFSLIREMIEKAESSGNKASAEIGYRFLRERQLIANEALEEFTPTFIARTICNYGLDNGMNKLNKILNSKIAATAEIDVIAEKTALLNHSNDLFGPQKEDACQSERLLAAEDKIKADAEREKQQLLVKKNAAEAAERTKEAPNLLRSIDNTSLCIMYGKLVNRETPSELLGVKNAGALIQSELNRRGLSVDKKLVLEGSIRIGSSECTVYASWGSPNDVNRTVGSWGVNKQLVYGSSSRRNYIYISNGRVNSFQD